MLFRTLFYTFAQAFLSVLVAVLAGMPAAFYITRRNFPLKKALSCLSAVPMCVPSLIMALGYISTFGISGLVNKFLMLITGIETPPLTFLYSFTGIIFCQGFYNFPLVMKTVSDSWLTLDSAEEDAARMLGAGECRIFFTITFTKLLPSLISAVIPIFLYCYFSFTIVLLFGATGSTTLEVAVYHAARSTLDYSKAAFYAAIETLTALFFVFLLTTLEKKFTINKTSVFTNLHQVKEIQRSELPVSLIFFFIICLCLVLPLLSIVISSFTVNYADSSFISVKNWIILFEQAAFRKALINTFSVALATSILCTILGTIYSIFLKLSDPYNHNSFLRVIPLTPMAVSSVAVGFFLMLIFRKSSVFTLIIAETLLTCPIAYRQVYAHVSKISHTTLDAASILSTNVFQKIFYVILPQCKNGILSSLCFCFALSTADSTLPLVLSIPSFDTLALYTFRLASSYKFSQSSCCGTLLAVICIGFFFLSEIPKKNRGNHND